MTEFGSADTASHIAEALIALHEQRAKLNAHRQRLLLPLARLRCRTRPRQAPMDPPLPAPDQRESRTL